MAGPRGFDAGGLAPLTVQSGKGRPMVVVDDAGRLDLRQLSKVLGKVDKDLRKELGRANKAAAQIAVDATKSKLASGGDPRFNGTDDVLAIASKTVKSRISSRKVAVVIGVDSARGGKGSRANLAFWGSKTRSGWFAASQFDSYTSFHQGFADWVGSGWNDLASGNGPYFVSPAIKENQKKILDKYQDGVEDAMRAAGFR